MGGAVTRVTLQEGKSEPFTEVASDHRGSLGKNCEAELVTLLCGARLGVVEVVVLGGGAATAWANPIPGMALRTFGKQPSISKPTI